METLLLQLNTVQARIKVETGLARVQIASFSSHWNTWTTSRSHLLALNFSLPLISLLRLEIARRQIADSPGGTRFARRRVESALTFPLHHEREGGEIASAVHNPESLLWPSRRTKQSLYFFFVRFRNVQVTW